MAEIICENRRVPTGISGFDEMCEGGLIRNRSYLVTGAAGCGKTIFGLQYLYNGIRKYKENGIYIATEERPDQVRENVGIFGWDFEALEDDGKLAIIDACSTKIGIPSHEKYVDVKPFDLRSMMDQIIAIQHTIDAKRALFDGTTSIGLFLRDPNKIRVELLKLSTTLKVNGLTSILTCELLTDNPGNSMFGVEEFLTDGVIKLYKERSGESHISKIDIIKMKGTSHSPVIRSFEITYEGIVIVPA